MLTKVLTNALQYDINIIIYPLNDHWQQLRKHKLHSSPIFLVRHFRDGVEQSGETLIIRRHVSCFARGYCCVEPLAVHIFLVQPRKRQVITIPQIWEDVFQQDWRQTRSQTVWMCCKGWLGSWPSLWWSRSASLFFFKDVQFALIISAFPFFKQAVQGWLGFHCYASPLTLLRAHDLKFQTSYTANKLAPQWYGG